MTKRPHWPPLRSHRKGVTAPANPVAGRPPGRPVPHGDALQRRLPEVRRTNQTAHAEKPERLLAQLYVFRDEAR